jgi:hypothetical protein
LSSAQIAGGELADVVQQGRALEFAPLLRPEVHFLGDQIGEYHNSVTVSPCVRALGVDHGGEGGSDIVKVTIIHNLDLPVWLKCQNCSP